MEGAHALATGSLLSFSEQALVDCVDRGKDNCAHGGGTYIVLEWFDVKFS